ncbi:MAG: TIGR04282 family arsenosugar biosynthesis glycosyltransferase [Nitrospirota bacterium]
MHKRCLLLFVKSPEKGTVKSRLAKDLGEDAALDLYRCFVLDLLQTLKGGEYAFSICYHPPEAGDAVEQWLGSSYASMPQRGNDLGERMRSAFEEVFAAGFSAAVIMGSDIPDLPHALIDEAFSSLESADSVIGPAVDGGYYLIGFRRDAFLPDIFENMPWSTDTVYEETMAVLERNHADVHVLPAWRDIDTLDDVKDLLARNKTSEFRTSRTMARLLAMRGELFSSR